MNLYKVEVSNYIEHTNIGYCYTIIAPKIDGKDLSIGLSDIECFHNYFISKINCSKNLVVYNRFLKNRGSKVKILFEQSRFIPGFIMERGKKFTQINISSIEEFNTFLSQECRAVSVVPLELFTNSSSNYEFIGEINFTGDLEFFILDHLKFLAPCFNWPFYSFFIENLIHSWVRKFIPEQLANDFINSNTLYPIGIKTSTYNKYFNRLDFRIPII